MNFKKEKIKIKEKINLNNIEISKLNLAIKKIKKETYNDK